MVEVTNALLIAGMSGNGGWKAAQLSIPGVEWPPLRGWKSKVIGKQITQDEAGRFLALRGTGKASGVAEPGLFGQQERSNRMKHRAFDCYQNNSISNAWIVRFDGSCNGNGYKNATGKFGFHVLDQNGQTLRFGSGDVISNLVTNNLAEWFGIRAGLQSAKEMKVKGVSGICIEGDSQLVISVLTTRWNSKKPELTALRDECWNILADIGVPWSATWIPREQNTYCDSLT